MKPRPFTNLNSSINVKSLCYVKQLCSNILWFVIVICAYIKTKKQFYCFGIPEFLVSESIIFHQKNLTVFNDEIISLKINQQGNF